MKKTILSTLTGAAALLCLGQGAAHAQLILTSSTYTQNFDGLANAGTTNAFANNSTIPGLFAYQSGGSAAAGTPATYRADAGTSTTGALYSYGAAAGTERAFGSLASGTPGNFNYGFVFTNNSGAATGFTLTLTGEQWRNGGNTTAQTLSFNYLIDTTGTAYSDAIFTSAGFTPDAALSFTTPTVGATAAALDGNAAANRTLLTDTVTINIPAGSTIYLRWTDLNDVGNDHALAIDDVTFTLVPEPSAYATLALGALGLFGVLRARRRTV